MFTFLAFGCGHGFGLYHQLTREEGIHNREEGFTVKKLGSDVEYRFSRAFDP